MMAVLWRRCGLRLLPSPCLPASCRVFQWSGETHYDVLGVLPTASPREIKVAYLGLSKQLHPDVNQGKDDKDTFTIHQKFVRVNQAYSVLGSREDRRLYDLQMGLEDRLQAGAPVQGRDSSGKNRTFYKTMTFAERAQAMGYKTQDPNHYQKQGNYHRKIAIACVVWIVAGILLQGVVIMRLYGRHTATLDKATEQNAMILTASRASAMNYTTLEEHREAFEQRFQGQSPRLHSSTLEEYNVEKEV